MELPEQPLLTCAARAGQRLIVSLVASKRRSRACGDICRSIPYGASVRQARWRSERGWNVSLSQRTSQAGEFERKPSSLSRGTEGSNLAPSRGESIANLTSADQASGALSVTAPKCRALRLGTPRMRAPMKVIFRSRHVHALKFGDLSSIVATAATCPDRKTALAAVRHLRRRIT